MGATIKAGDIVANVVFWKEWRSAVNDKWEWSGYILAWGGEQVYGDTPSTNAIYDEIRLFDA